MTEEQIIRLITQELNKKTRECTGLKHGGVEFVSAYSRMLALNELLFKINLINLGDRLTPPGRIEYEQSD